MRLLVVALSLITLFGCSHRQSTLTIKCKRADLATSASHIAESQLSQSDRAKLDELVQAAVSVPNSTKTALDDFDWAKDVYVCTIRDFLFVLPVQPSVDGFQLSSQRTGINILGEQEDVFLTGQHGVDVFLRDMDQDGRFDRIEYTSCKSNACTSAEDSNLDGQPDTRTRPGDAGTVIHEAWVEGRWQQVVLNTTGLRLFDHPSQRLLKNDHGDYYVIDDPIP
jgi:hypothetical protein